MIYEHTTTYHFSMADTYEHEGVSLTIAFDGEPDGPNVPTQSALLAEIIALVESYGTARLYGKRNYTGQETLSFNVGSE